MDPQTPHPVIDLMDSQRDVRDMGGTQRLGAYIAELAEGSQVAKAYGTTVVTERHRHRYEFNSPVPLASSRTAGLWCSGMSPDGRLVEFIELPSHPFWVGTQAHPEFKSRPNRPAPLFRDFVGAALARAEGRNPHLDLDHRGRRAGAAAERLIFRKVGERVVHRGHVIDLGDRHVRSATTAPRSSARSCTIPARSPSSPSTTTACAVLVRQYRAAVDGELLELPAGKLDVDGEDPMACAQRELAEEVGLAADEWELLVAFHNSPGFSDELRPDLPGPVAPRGARRPAGHRGGGDDGRRGSRWPTPPPSSRPARSATPRPCIGLLLAREQLGIR